MANSSVPKTLKPQINLKNPLTTAANGPRVKIKIVAIEIIANAATTGRAAKIELKAITAATNRLKTAKSKTNPRNAPTNAINNKARKIATIVNDRQNGPPTNGVEHNLDAAAGAKSWSKKLMPKTRLSL